MSELAVPRSPRVSAPRAESPVVAKPDGYVREPQGPATLTVRATRRYRDAAESVFEAWLKPEIAVSWLFATATRPLASAEIDARVGGRFRLAEAGGRTAGEWTGRYLDIEPHRRLVFTLSIEPQPATWVAVEIVKADRGCRLVLEHKGVPRGVAARIRQRWIGILYGLDATLRAAANAPRARFARSRRGAGQGMALALETP